MNLPDNIFIHANAIRFLLTGLLLFVFCCFTEAGTIILDPGHGGSDSGTVAHRRFPEKTASLDVARRLQTSLRAAGHKVMMTRSTDTFVDLPKRVELSNRTPGKPVFVSIHFNSSPSRDACGIETYRYNFQSNPLALAIHRKLIQSTGAVDRGVRSARFYVLRHNKHRSVLLELGFLTHSREGSKIVRSTEYRQKLADAISAGIRSVVK